MKAVFLDYKDINIGDISWGPMEALCDIEYYELTPDDQIAERIGDAEAVFMDCAPITRETMEKCPNLKFIGIGATGFNHIDLEAAKEHGIAVTNVPAYSTEAVAQHTIALLLNITNKIAFFNDHIRASVAEHAAGGPSWPDKSTPIFQANTPLLLEGKSIGIVGYGNIGSKVAEIAKALGMTVNIYSRDKEAAITSDIVSFHCPLTPENRGMVNDEFISKMKDGAILLNAARGGLVDEEALAKALKSGKLLAAGLDVTVNEPPHEDCPLLECDNCFITPHMAFMPTATRAKIIDVIAANLQSFFDGGDLNRLV